ncbi:type IV pilus biogenesis protein PilM [Niallia sp. JL1B1071]|uniref:type IV pilus biogenesis protein PilM n=1 Tax=Niallia tiangongensis TaxID=3237105 RepID=UPI0037DC353D
MGLFRNKRTVQLIFNDHSIRYMEMKQINPPQPIKWGERVLPEGIIRNGKVVNKDSLQLILEECAETWKIKKREIQMVVPDALIIIRKISIPADIKEDELNEYLYLEIGTSIHLPFEEPVFDTVVLKEEEKKEVLLIAAQAELVQEYVDALTEAKLYPVAADISSLAAFRIYERLYAAAEEERLLFVHMDLENVNITIFEHGYPIFAHFLPFTFIREDWEIRVNRSQHSELSFQGDIKELMIEYDNIFREVNRLMDFYRYSIHQGREQLMKIILTGDHPMLPTMKEELSTRFELPIIMPEVDSLLTGFKRSLPSAFHLVLGLALKEVK